MFLLIPLFLAAAINFAACDSSQPPVSAETTEAADTTVVADNTDTAKAPETEKAPARRVVLYNMEAVRAMGTNLSSNTTRTAVLKGLLDGKEQSLQFFADISSADSNDGAGIPKGEALDFEMNGLVVDVEGFEAVTIEFRYGLSTLYADGETTNAIVQIATNKSKKQYKDIDINRGASCVHQGMCYRGSESLS